MTAPKPRQRRSRPPVGLSGSDAWLSPKRYRAARREPPVDITLTPEQLDLLQTYRAGKPVIWDAASLDKIVQRLLWLDLLKPAGPESPRACVITDKGRQVLAQEVGA
jgi:hypothetical protein